ncbi:MAG: peptide chain release factor-like protein [Candidatus Omnitrophica bacterium]|nr:peptide chain release factor-like protein [Candidatus Omnitrophota bacterium]
MSAIRPEKERELKARMQAAGLREEDIEEKFVRSSGPGGQHANKTATCVYLKHRPSGIEVKMQKERSQALNRFLARRVLSERYEREVLGQETPEQSQAAKIRKQKQRRVRRRSSKSDHGIE